MDGKERERLGDFTMWVRYGTTVEHLEQRFQPVNRRYGTSFTVRRFRQPKRNADGTWNCRFSLPVLVTRYDCIEHEHGIPDRLMFDLRFVRAQVMHNSFLSTTVFAMKRLIADDPGSPVVPSIGSVDWVLSWEDAITADILLDVDSGEPHVPCLYAVVEQCTGLVYPVACGTSLVFRTARDEDGTLLLQLSVGDLRYKEPGYDDPEKSKSESELLSDVKWYSRALRRQLMLRYDERHAPVRNAVRELREDCKEER